MNTFTLPTTSAELNNMTDDSVAELATAHGFSFRAGRDNETPNEYRLARNVAARGHLVDLIRTAEELSTDVATVQRIDSQQIERLTAELKAATERAETWQNRFTSLETSTERFKVEAGKIAMRYAKANDWCSTAQEALREMGIPIPEERYRAQVTITLDVEFTNTTLNDTDSYFVRRSTEVETYGGELKFGLDHDFEDVDIITSDFEWSEPQAVESD